MTLGGRALRGRAVALLHLDDPPWRIALALAVGVFISCTPFYFFQTVLAFVIATVFRLNKAATVTGTWLNLPWFAPFLYAGALRIGTALVPESEAAASRALAILRSQPSAFAWQELPELLKHTSVALLVGTTLVGLLCGGLTYVIALRLISAERARRDRAARGDRRAA